ncbi:unnamed protein product [Cuscuta campestris]|uniref:Uncharacterized protein n=1 Tax=Cuscuta campestris TaxID=132261 RepID=A0A484KK61_9ASTE|nr:unnamed protein product [Cuscuta campestris]
MMMMTPAFLLSRNLQIHQSPDSELRFDFEFQCIRFEEEIGKGMAISDAVVGNLTTLYLAAIVAMKAYASVTGRIYGGAFVLAVSTATVGALLVASLTWDVSRKASYALTRRCRHRLGRRQGDLDGNEMCSGGICWHGVAVKCPASQVRFRLPQT